MRFAIFLYVASFLSLTPAKDLVPECPTATPDLLAEAKKLTVKEDIHDQLVGEFGEVWRSYSDDCEDGVTYVRHRLNDKELHTTKTLRGRMYENGVLTLNTTLVKVENGVYIKKSLSGKLTKVYFVFAKHNVLAYFYCVLDTQYHLFSGVDVRTALMTTPLSREVQKTVDEAVQRIKSKKDILGNITRIWPQSN